MSSVFLSLGPTLAGALVAIGVVVLANIAAAIYWLYRLRNQSVRRHRQRRRRRQ